jgi:excisionase family DNA binding protein
MDIASCPFNTERSNIMTTNSIGTPKLGFSIRECVEATSLSRTTIYSHISSGRLRATRVGGRTIIPADSLRALIEGETVGLEGRLLSPMIGDVVVAWDKALNAVADGFRAAIDTYGPDSVAIYGSGQLLTEDYYAANKLMKGFIGSGNIDTNSRLCMASAVAAHTKGRISALYDIRRVARRYSGNLGSRLAAPRRNFKLPFVDRARFAGK